MRLPCVLTLIFLCVATGLAGKVPNDSIFSFVEDPLRAKIFNKCAEESQYGEEDLTNLDIYFRGKADSRFKCFQLCLYKGHKIMNNDGQVNPEKLVHHHLSLPIPEYREYITECAKKTKGDDDCDLAFNIAKCVGYPQ